MNNVISKGRHSLGKLSRNGDKSAPRNCEAVLTWELRESDGKVEFAASGEVWNHLKTDIVRGGQCVDELAALFPRDVLAQRIRQTWAAYHLNGMNAGTQAQSAAIETWEARGNRYEYAAVCAHLESIGLLEVPVTDAIRAAALGGLPCDATTYKYGSRGLHYAIPEETIALIKRGFQDTDETLAADPSEAGEPDRDLVAESGLTVWAEFVPFSRSRNKGEKQPSLNWRVTIKCKGRVVLTSDYSAGSAHCPADKKKWESRSDKREAIYRECEKGQAVTRLGFGGHVNFGNPINPDMRDVISSLLSDASVLDCGSFTEWASEYGYDPDSIKARDTYGECLACALALRGAVGSEMFEALRAGNE